VRTEGESQRRILAAEPVTANHSHALAGPHITPSNWQGSDRSPKMRPPDKRLAGTFAPA